MSFLEGFSEALLAELCGVAITVAFGARLVLRDQLIPVIQISLLHRRGRVRFSASALLNLSDQQSHVLVETSGLGSAPPYLGPLGGVIKYGSDSRSFLDESGIREHISPEAFDDMDRDIRLVMKSAVFFRFIQWFRSADGRETPTEALCRELREELSDVGHPEIARMVDKIELRVVKVRATGVLRDPSDRGLRHYRLFYICELVGPHAAAFKRSVLDAVDGERLALVPDDDIRAGGYKGMAVGGHSIFVMADGRYRGLNPNYTPPPS